MRKLPVLVALAAAATLALSGCTDASQTGATSGSDDSSSPAPTFDLSSIQKDDAAAKLLPADVAASGKLTVGTDTTYAPAEFIDPDGKTPVGYDIDLIDAVAAVLGLDAEPQTAEFPSIIPGLGSKYDVGISSFTITPERLESANMVSYFSAGEAYAVPKGNPEKLTVDDICGMTVTVQNGTIQDDEVDDISTKCESDGKDPLKVLNYDSQADATTNVVGGKADVMFADSPIVQYAVTQTDGQLEQLGDTFSSAPQGIAVAKDDEDLAKAIQAALQVLMDDGDMTKILDVWGASDGALDTAELNPAS
ncbi:ABC transporter substrate-binding protein [Cellulomonas sp. PhB143]|uniref:ABC transporter substrate-binding protein n=1 Tax=Cellulomonas sp. PhB143 TaxID=2485186 RepID=UPI000F4ACEC1|nr:ABC transporter substrate-binding protein [Cellulomonas sp. PhB143]ROS73387.1 amino acid ABC transporter substrate-binding protein (PAAT family) [Cellulomonas sp. PhB143]